MAGRDLEGPARPGRVLRERPDRRGVSLGMLLLLDLPRPARAELSPALVDSTVDVMRCASVGRPVIPGTGMPAPFAGGARSIHRDRSSPAVGRCAPLALALLATGVTRLGGGPRVVEGDEVAAIPSNLMDVLNVCCR